MGDIVTVLIERFRRNGLHYSQLLHFEDMTVTEKWKEEIVMRGSNKNLFFVNRSKNKERKLKTNAK